MSDLPPSVKAMTDDPRAPTAPLREFVEAFRRDDSLWWTVGCGHHLNLFEAALDVIADPESVEPAPEQRLCAACMDWLDPDEDFAPGARVCRLCAKAGRS